MRLTPPRPTSLHHLRTVNPPPTYLTTYRITTTTGTLTVEAFSLAHAIRTALELIGGTLLSCLQQGDCALGLSVRVYNALRRAGFTHADQLSRLSDEQLGNVKLIGPDSIREVRDKLRGCLAAQAAMRP